MSKVNLNGGPLAGLPPELQTKVLKKIAQLTKVIYTLHTKSEDQDQIAEAIRMKYQEDLEKSGKEFEARLEQLQCRHVSEIEKYKEHIGKADGKVQQVRELLRGVENQAETQKSYYIRELSALEKKYQRELDKLVESVAESENRAVNVKQTQEVCDERIKRLEEAHTQETDRILSKFGQENKLLQREIVSLKTEQELLSNEKDEMITEHRDETQKLETERETLLENQREAEEMVQKRIAEMRDESAKEKELANAQISGMTNKINSLQTENQRLSSATSELQNKLSGTSNESEGLQREVKELARAKKSLEEELGKRGNELQTALQQLGAVNEAGSERSRVLQELELTVSTLETTVSSLQAERDALFTSLSEAREDKEKHISRSKQSDKLIEGKVRSLEQECSKLRHQVNIQNQELEAERERFKSSLEQQGLSLETEGARRLEGLEEEHRVAMKNAEENTQAALIQLHQDLKASHQFQADKLCSEKDDVIRSLEESIEALVRAVNDKTREMESLAARLKERESGAVTAAEEVRSLQTKLRTVASDLREKSEKETTLLREKATLEEKCNLIQLEARRRELELVNAAKTETSSAILELNEKWELRLREEIREAENSLRESQTAELSRSKLESEQRLKIELERVLCKWDEKERDSKQRVTKLEKELKQAREDRVQLESRLLEKERMLSREMKERENNFSISRSEVDRMREQYEKDLEGLRLSLSMKSATEMRDLKEQYEKEMAAVRSGHAASVNALKDTLNREKLSVLREIESRHRAEVEAMKSNSKQSLESFQKQSEEESQLLISEREVEFKKVLGAKERALTEREKEIETMKGQINSQHTSKSEYRADVSRLQNAIKELGDSLEEKESELLTVRREASQILKQRENSIRVLHQKDVRALEEKYQIRAKQLAADFTLIRRGLEEKLEEMNGELQKSDKRYFSREPRSEDLLLISELQATLKRRELELSKLSEEAKLYKLELVNREQNYNKMFGTKPKIGPLTPRSKSSEGTVQRNSFPSAPSLSSHKSKVLSATRETTLPKPTIADKSKTMGTSSHSRLQHST